MGLSIKRVVPLEQFKLIIEFDDGSLRQFPGTRVAETPLWFLAFPTKLSACDVTPSGLQWQPVDKTLMWDDQNVWAQEASLDIPALLEWSACVSAEELSHGLLTVAMTNQAPTEQDSRHHVYSVGIKPFCDGAWVVLGESIGGGFAERGGSVALAVENLDSFSDWRRHCVLAGCDWMVPLLEADATDAQRKARILECYRESLAA
ncbi:hypothetical protein Y5S_00813 [Alcanivorax nanhaiticus]|uniref:DUF2442 domain-containing protein n=1 Tax=Alcanivorax nanhaiticus TaxID=1177154 RepID=A0A095SMQ8_9GAMM|nr:hypothetical protein [Alcanivorax nanhaiticus]KGD65589.1 hypothetical protein Y5S_00813 [Alcanivorax nanhaiticus]